jgi:hypothetical protein
MKWFMAIGAVLVLPALAYGGASLTLTVGGSGTTGATAITIDPDDSFTLDLGVIHDFSYFAGFNAGLQCDTADVFKALSRTVHLSNWSANKTNKNLFTEQPWLKTSALAEQDYGAIHDTSYWSGSPLDTQTITLDTEASVTPGVYNITLGSPGLAGLNVMDESYTLYAPDSVGTFEVTITPEPASMLLLIGALPFLRRRRSS